MPSVLRFLLHLRRSVGRVLLWFIEPVCSSPWSRSAAMRGWWRRDAVRQRLNEAHTNAFTVAAEMLSPEKAEQLRGLTEEAIAGRLSAQDLRASVEALFSPASSDREDEVLP